MSEAVKNNHDAQISQPRQTPEKGSWVANVAAEAWSATKDGARVLGQVGYGAYEQIKDHPWQTAGEVAAGAGFAVTSEALGIGALGVGAIAAAPLAAIGLYKAGQIASKEGIGAIPDHIKQSYDETKASILLSASAISDIYKNDATGSKLASSEQVLQKLGRDTVPIIAAVFGSTAAGLTGAGGEAAVERYAPLNYPWYRSIDVEKSLPYAKSIESGAPSLVGSELAGSAIGRWQKNRDVNEKTSN